MPATSHTSEAAGPTGDILGAPIKLGEARKRLADIIETDALFADDPRVVRLRRWLADVAKTNGIDVREDADPSCGMAAPSVQPNA